MKLYRVTFGTTIDIDGKDEMTGFSDTIESSSLIHAIGMLSRKHGVNTMEAISAELIDENP